MRLTEYFDRERLVHGFKTALACLIGFLIMNLVHFHFDQWLIVTIIVVMCAQINVGSVIQKSYMRFLGTFFGSMIAVCTLLIFGADEFVIALVVILASFIFSYIATSEASYSDSGTLGAVTIVIILVGKNPTVMTAFERFVEISIGIFIAALISQFILPIHARRHLKLLQANTIRQLRAFYLATLLTDQTTENIESYQLLDESIVKSLIKQRKLATDAGREPFGVAFNSKRFKQLLNCEKEILRCITFMHYAYRSSPDTKKVFSNMNLLRDFHDLICQALDKIAECIEVKKVKRITVKLPNIDPLKEVVEKGIKKFSPDDIVYANGYLFCAEILITQVHQLAALVTPLVSDNVSKTNV